jgi:hypothetical protein
MGHQALKAHQGDVRHARQDTQNVFLCRCQGFALTHQADGVGQAVHNVPMRAQRDREEQSVLIGTALGVFALVATAEALGLWLAHFVFDFEGSNAMVGWVIVIAGMLAGANLIRSEKG